MDEKLKEAYQQKIEGHMKQWRSKIHRLKDKTKVLEVDLKIKYHKRLEDLQTMLDQLEKKLQQLKGIKGESWEGFKDKVDDVLDSLRESLRHRISKMK